MLASSSHLRIKALIAAREEFFMDLFIGGLANATGVKIPTIRFYEEIGLLSQARRAANDRRIYDDVDVRRLSFIRDARQLGFSVEAIRDLLDLSDHPEGHCGAASQLAAQQLAVVTAKIAQLEILQVELRRMAASACDGLASDCRIIDALANFRGLPERVADDGALFRGRDG